jgi:hypothetical protein
MAIWRISPLQRRLSYWSGRGSSRDSKSAGCCLLPFNLHFQDWVMLIHLVFQPMPFEKGLDFAEIEFDAATIVIILLASENAGYI